MSALRLSDLLDHARAAIRRGSQVVYMYANLHTLNLAYEYPRFRETLRHADVVYCDGFGVKLAARLMGGTLPQRFTLPDWIGELCQMCIEQGDAIFLLGGEQGVAARAAEVLCARYPALRIAGTHHGYFDRTSGALENQAVIAQITSTNPAILLVCFGSPAQEYWIDENHAALNIPVLMSGGALLDYISGRINRAPRLLTDHGLEWLGRLLMEPRRLWKRYLVGMPLFFVRLLITRLRASRSTSL